MKVELNNEEKEVIRRQQVVEILVGDLFFYILEILKSSKSLSSVGDFDQEVMQWGRRFITGIFSEIENRARNKEV